MVDAGIVESFHRMWDNFPERARLIHRDRTVLAVNKAAAVAGFAPGERCVDALPRGSHAGCLADQALRERRGLYNLSVGGNRLRFWVPVEGCDDVYVHLSLPKAWLEA